MNDQSDRSRRSRPLDYRAVLFFAAVIAAIVTPTTDIITMLALWVPIGAVLCAAAALVNSWARRTDNGGGQE